MRTLSGHWMCGAVTLSFEPLKDELGVCHCDQCRRWTGVAYLEIDAKPGTLTFEGPVKTYTSSEWAERSWCDRCGSTLWYHLTLPGYDDFYSVAAGLVDNAGGLRIAKEIYIDQKPEGFSFSGDHITETKADVEARFSSFRSEANK